MTKNLQINKSLSTINKCKTQNDKILESKNNLKCLPLGCWHYIICDIIQQRDMRWVSSSERLVATSTKLLCPLLKWGGGKQTLVEAAKRSIRVSHPYRD